MNRERLKQVLRELRERHEDEWNSIKEQIFEKIAELKDLVKKESLEEYISRIAEIVGDLHGKIFFWWVGDPEGLRRFLSLQEVRELLNLAEGMNELTQMQLIGEKLRNAITASRRNRIGAGMTTFSSWLSVFNPKFFMPTWRGTINRYLRNDFGIEEFYLARDIEKFIEFTKTVKEVANELRIDSMIEVAFYLSKYGGSDDTSNFRQFLKTVGEKFLEAANREGLNISEDQLKPVSGVSYRQILLPQNIREITGNHIHFEWLLDPNQGKIIVGLHLEYPSDRREMNQQILDFLLQKINFEELAGRVDGELEIRRYPVWKWILISRPYSELNEELENWAINTMVEFYKEVKEVFPALKEFVEKAPGSLPEELKKKLENLLDSKKQVILYGPPGTGKTWIARNYVKLKTNDNKELYKFVTFHPSYCYEEFVEGIRPKTDKEDRIHYEVEDGVFKRICKQAYNTLLEEARIPNHKGWNKDLPELSDDEKQQVEQILEDGNYTKFYLVIDEINRGDISRIFGELITLLEADKRLFAKNEIIVTLPYSKTKFGVPPNLFIIGTMNTADRSIALIDIALRRRFGFIELMPSYKVLINELGIDNVESEKQAIEKIKSWNRDDLSDINKLTVKILYSINEKIKEAYDRDHQIGHSYFLKLKDCKTRDETMKTLKYIWFHEVIPLLQEYFYDSPKKLKEVLGEKFVMVDENETTYEFKHMEEFSDEEFISALKELAQRGERSE